MSFRLVPLIKKTAPIIDLQRPILLIGRHMDCDVRLDTPKISRRHCCVAMAYDRLLIRDLGSRNGVRLNGRLIEEAQLQSGDEVAIGPIVFRLEPLNDRPEAAATRPAPATRPGGLPIPPPQPVSAAPRSKRPDSDGDLVPLDDI
jgi:pSer/pThr/pTyr-binding forkhead associated (FHA) protein